MMIRASSVMLFFGGVMLFMFSKIVPLLQEALMDWIGVFMMGGGLFILLFCFSVSGTGLQYDTIPAGSAIVNYIRRDGIIAPLLGKRVFSGESFLDVPKLGLIEDLGKDTVFLWGRKKVRFGLENISYTPDLRYANLTHELYKLGFDDSDDLYNILNIPNMDPDRDKAKKTYYLSRMAEINWNLDHQGERGAERLIRGFKQRPQRTTSFGKPRHTPPAEDKPKENPRDRRNHRNRRTPEPQPIEPVRQTLPTPEPPKEHPKEELTPIAQPVGNINIDELIEKRLRELLENKKEG